jgi:hypothetical protein
MSVKEKLLAVGLLLGAALTPPAFEASAQAQPTPKPTAPAVVVKPAGTPATTTAPRAGGFPMELAMPLLAGGAAALGGGAYLLRRGKQPD